MLVDVHTNLFWYPDHLSEEFVEFSWAAKRAKMRLTPDVHCDVTDESWKHKEYAPLIENALRQLVAVSPDLMTA